MNKIILVGRLVRDPEPPRVFQTGNSLVEFTIAVDKRIKPKNADEATADFFRCKAWGKTGEIVTNYLKKGRQVAVEGRMESRKFVDKDGNNREGWDVSIDNLSLIGDRPRDGDSGESGGGPSYGAPAGSSATAPRASAPAAASVSEDDYDPFADN